MISVLYVDDEQGLLDLGKFFLEQGGQFSLDIITSAPAALSLLQSKNFDAIISDYQMPDMDGIEFLKHIRGSGNSIPFILFTGRGREEVVIQALNEGADFYLQKGGDPVAQFTELSHKILQAVQRRRAEASIRDHERREQDIINFLPDATFAIDTNGIVIAWNRVFEKITGIPASQMLGTGDYEYALAFYGERRPVLIDLIFSPPDEIRKYYPNVIPDGTTFTAEITYTNSHGESRTLWVKASPLYDKSGKIVGAIESFRDITEQKKAEETLRTNQIVLTEAMDLAHLAIWEYDSKMGMFTFDDRNYLLFGTTERDEGGYQMSPDIYIREFVHPDDRDRMIREIERNVTRSEPHYIEQLDHKIIRRDGEVRYIVSRFGRITSNDGNINKIRGVNQDITELKKAEQELRAAYEQLAATDEELRSQYEELARNEKRIRESEEKYRRIVDTSNEGIVQVDEKVEITYINRRMTEILGHLPEEVIGRNVYSFIPDDALADQNRQVEERMQGRYSRYERRLITKDGQARWFQISATPIMADDGTFRGSFAMLSDITERKRAVEEITFKNLILSTQQETSLDAILVVDDSGRIINYNRQFTALWGIPEDLVAKRDDEPVLQYLTEYLPDQKAFLSRVRYLYEHREEKSFEELLLKDGRVLERFSSPILGENGKYYGRVWYFRDITERKQAEIELRKAHDLLEERVSQRTADLYIANLQLQKEIKTRNQINSALQESEERFRTLIEKAPEAILLFDADLNRYVEANAKAEQLFGCSRQQLLDRGPQQFYLTDQGDGRSIRETTDEHRIQALAGEEALYERQIRNARGEDRIVEGRLVHLPSPTRTLFRSSYIDITERKRIESALMESEERYRVIVEKDYRSILENIQEVFYRTDAKGNLTFLSPSGAARLGYSGTENAIGRPVTHYYANPEQREPFLAALEKNGSVSNMEITLKRKDGSPIIVSVSSHVYNDASGTYAGVEGIYRDITRFKQMQEELRHSEEMYRVLVEHIQDGAFLIQDSDDILLMCNESAAAMMGYTPQEIIGFPATNLIAPEDREMVIERQRKRLEDKSPPECYEVRMIHKDATTRIPVTVSVGISTYKDRPAFVGTFRHVTTECD